MTSSRTLRSDDPMAVELMAALERGDVERLRRLVAAHAELACRVVENAKGGGRTPLHLFADWPGRKPNPAAIMQTFIEAGVDLDAPAVGTWHSETPLHWAASNDDVTLIDALLDAGADIERPGSSIDCGSPLSCAVGYGQWAAAERLVERSARTLFCHEAALGLMPAITARVEVDPPPQPEQLSGPFWNACHGGQLAVAQYLLAHGADLNWVAPWSGQTPLDIAEHVARSDIVAWLIGKSATRGKKTA